MRPGLTLATAALVAGVCTAASDHDEFKVKREAVFEFAQKPAVTREGDRVTIAFETTGFCDVTVAVEEADSMAPSPPRGEGRGEGSAAARYANVLPSPSTLPERERVRPARIVRHLASGVLGPNAPEPFQKNSKKQILIWDGKDDQGRYIDEKDKLTVRVSLGLEPRFERNLFWSPCKRFGAVTPLIQAAPEGVYVLDSRTVSHLRLFDHDGIYQRTVHPPPADVIGRLQGIDWKVSPQTGEKVPVLRAFVLNRFLTSGEGAFNEDTTHHGDAMYSATALDVYTGGAADAARSIALAFIRLNRLSTDGSTGGLPLEGPMTGYLNVRTNHFFHKQTVAGPSSMAFSPDGRTIYLTGYMWPTGSHLGRGDGAMHGVRRMAYAGAAEPENFLGRMATDGEGTDPGQFACPTSVAVDGEGRIYVSDYLNDRVQVFSPEGNHLKSLPARRPAKVMLNPHTGEVLVLSWYLPIVGDRLLKKYGLNLNDLKQIEPTMVSLGTFDAPRGGRPAPIPLKATDVPEHFYIGQPFEVELDPWASEPTLWVAERKTTVSDSAVRHIGAYGWESDRVDWGTGGIRLYGKKDGDWVLKRDFGDLARRSVHRVRPPSHGGQRLTVDPTTGALYVLEYRGHLGMKSNTELLRIDPETGRVRPVTMPMSAEEVCFDLNGHVYAREARMVMRYDPATWQEIPWDYGERRQEVGMAEKTSAVGGLALPGRMPSTGHQEGMFVSSRMRIAVSCFSVEQAIKPTYGKGYEPGEGYRPYVPTIYPGRIRWQEIHVFDETGRVLYEDAVPGLAHLSGLGMDEEDNLYVLAGGARVIEGKNPFNPWSGTLIKLRPRRARIVASKQQAGDANAPQVALDPSDFPKRPHDLESAVYEKAWVDGAEWFFGGVGYSGFSYEGSHRGNRGYLWDDWHSRFAFDGYSRSFVHELDNFSIAVVDKGGNLVLRFGRYGNVDDGAPVSGQRSAFSDQQGLRGREPEAHSIGDDEVALMRPTTLATHSDRRLFIADLGNARILSVRLDYHAAERVALKDVKEGG